MARPAIHAAGGRGSVMRTQTWRDRGSFVTAEQRVLAANAPDGSAPGTQEERGAWRACKVLSCQGCFLNAALASVVVVVVVGLELDVEVRDKHLGAPDDAILAVEEGTHDDQRPVRRVLACLQILGDDE